MKKLLLASIVAFSIVTNAQVGPPQATNPNTYNGYGFEQISGTYTPLSAGRTIWQSGETLATNAVSSAIALPFTFTFNGKGYTSIYINNNGFITFGNASTATTYNPLSTNTTINDGAVAGFAINLKNANTTTSEISYETIGSIFVIQFTDLQGNSVASGDTQLINFQIQLDSSNNSIAIVYGSCASGAANLAGQVGLKGAESSDVNNRAISVSAGINWDATFPGTLAGNTCTIGTTGGITIPALGLTFKFYPGIALAAPTTYATLPYTEDFANWVNGNSVLDLPNASYWRSWPSRGDNSWRPNNISEEEVGYTNSSGWSSASETSTTVIASPAVVPTARFRSNQTQTGFIGYMDLYVDLSTGGEGGRVITFDYRNHTGTDKLDVLLSTDGGTTFSSLGSTLEKATTWTPKTFTTFSKASTAIVRFLGTGDFALTNQDDVFFDNLKIDVDPTLAVSEVKKTTVSIYPNPFADVLNISDVKNVKSVSVIDVSGRLVKTVGNPDSSIQLRELRPGTYMIIIDMNDGSKQIIKTIKK